jgi:hypothetical protein
MKKPASPTISFRRSRLKSALSPRQDVATRHSKTRQAALFILCRRVSFFSAAEAQHKADERPAALPGSVHQYEDQTVTLTLRSTWGDPARCPKGGGEMKAIAFIECRDQPDVVGRIFPHCGFWDRPASRAPAPLGVFRTTTTAHIQCHPLQRRYLCPVAGKQFPPISPVRSFIEATPTC